MKSHTDMNTPQDGGPAFSYWNCAENTTGGMSLRDWFAGMALQHIPELLHANMINRSGENIAEWAYYVADAMLAARERKEDA